MLELTIHLDSHLRKPLYEQIYDYIRISIADGKISCGEKLPSTRFLSSHLGVARSTAETAYAQLLSEGYIEAKPCRGYYACDISGLYAAYPAAAKTAPEIRRREAYRIDFSPDENDFSCFPFAAWRKVSKEALACEDRSLLAAGEAAGEWGLREAVCRYLYQARGVNCRPGQLVIGAGNEYLLMLLAQVLGPGKKVAIENPTYRNAYRTLANMGYQMIAVPGDKYGIRVGEMEVMQPDIVYAMPSHQFPMGTVMPLKRRLMLLKWASGRRGRYIIEDDHDSEFRYKGKPIPSLQGIDGSGTVIYLGTFSRSISPAIRVSYMVLPEELLFSYRTNCGFYASTVPREQQMVLEAFLNGGYFERHLNKMRRIYKGKHDSFHALLKKEAWVKKIYGDFAGVHLLVETDANKSAAEIVNEAKRKGGRAYALTEYLMPGNIQQAFGEGFFKTLLLGYGGRSEEELSEGIACIRGIAGKANEPG